MTRRKATLADLDWLVDVGTDRSLQVEREVAVYTKLLWLPFIAVLQLLYREP